MSRLTEDDEVDFEKLNGFHLLDIYVGKIDLHFYK